MIDFRYHLVSIVAIFLALALGIVLGSTTLSNSVSDTLRQQANSAAKTAQQARLAQRDLQHQVNGQEQFTEVLSPQLVENRLKGQSVVLVETPGAGDDSIEQVSELAKNAGAAVTGRVTIQTKFLDDDQQTTVDELATQLKADDVTFPDDANAYAKAGAVLANALVTKDPAKSGREDAAGGAVLNGFKEAGYVTTSGKPGQHATLAVMVALRALRLRRRRRRQQGTDLAGLRTRRRRARYRRRWPADLRAGGWADRGAARLDAADSVSAVDVVDTASGQVVAILALQKEIGGKSGQYGTGAA